MLFRKKPTELSFTEPRDLLLAQNIHFTRVDVEKVCLVGLGFSTYNLRLLTLYLKEKLRWLQTALTAQR